MSLFSKAAAFTRTPQGRKLLDRAQTEVSKPQNKQKIADLQRKLQQRGRRQP